MHQLALIFKWLIYSLLNLVGVAGFELATPCSQSRYTNRTVLHPEISPCRR